MDLKEKFLTRLIKDFKEKGFVKFIEENSEYILRFALHTLADVAVCYLMKFIRQGLNWMKFFFETHANTNSFIRTIHNVLDTMELLDVDKIKTYLKAAHDLLTKLLNGNFKWCEKKINNGERFIKNLAQLTVATTVPASSYDQFPCTPQRTETKTENQSSELTQNSSITANNGIKKEYIVGTRIIANSKFKACEKAEKKLYYYIGNVDKTCSEQYIIDYLTQQIPDGKFTCNKLNSKGPNQGFKLTANSSCKNILENPDFWPQGVHIRRFFLKKKTIKKDCRVQTLVTQTVFMNRSCLPA